MHVLLLEPWMHGSHRQWAEGYQANSRHQIDVIGMPAGRWRWTLRGGALALAAMTAEHVRHNGMPDVVMVSGIIDVAHLLGLLRRDLAAATPIVIYQHESQLLYPGRRAQDQEIALRNWLSWCAADLVLFNSNDHRDRVVSALPAFLGQFPEPSHLEVLDAVVSRFEVLPIGLDLPPWPEVDDGGHDRPPESRLASDGPTILWPHRWEPDKNPEIFKRAVAKLVDHDLRFRLILAGEDPPAGNSAASALRAAMGQRFAQNVVAIGPFTRARFRRLMASADLVVSCADHDFFGVSIVEAVGAGARPLLPNALVYPEAIPARWHPVSLYQRGAFGAALVEVVKEYNDDPVAAAAAVAGLAVEMGRFDWSLVAPRYDRRLEGLT